MIAETPKTIRTRIERVLRKLVEAAIAMETDIAAVLENKPTRESPGEQPMKM